MPTGEEKWSVHAWLASLIFRPAGLIGAAHLRAMREKEGAPVTSERRLEYLVQLLHDPACSCSRLRLLGRGAF